MAKNEEQVLVRIINKVEGAEKLIQEKNLVKELVGENGKLTRVYEEQTATQRKRVTTVTDLNKGKREERVANKEVLAQGPKFQLHYLGIMFGGMALNRVMSGLTATSKEWVGIGELMATTMGVVMLPATLELLDQAIIPLMDTLLGLPTEIQTVIGVTVLGLEGLGKIAEFGGQIALGVGAFKIAFPALAASISSGLSKALQSKVGTGIIIAVGLTVAWQSIEFIREGINEGSLIEELIGVLGVASGLGLVGWALGGPVGGLIGFTLGIGVGLIIDWAIAENRWVGKARELDVPEDIIGEHVFRNSLLGGLLSSGKGPSSDFIQQSNIVDMALDGPEGINFQGFAVGGNVTNNGLHFLHEGETVLRKDEAQSGGGPINITNNINVSDSREMERMIKNNNDNLIREIRRDSRV